MSLFSFGDIRFNTTYRSGSGSSSQLLGEGKYGYNVMRYPSDLGTYGKGHYIVFHVNEQRKSEFKTGPVNNGDEPTIFQNRRNLGTPTLGSSLSNIGDSLINSGSRFFGLDAENVRSLISRGLSSVDFASDQEAFNLGFTRTIQRTTDTIALYMPDTLNFVHDQSYSDLALGGKLSTAVLSSGGSLVDTIKAAGIDNKLDTLTSSLKNLSPFLSLFAKQTLGDLGTVLFAAGAQMVENPMLEIIYSSPSFRKFRFDFMFYPNSEIEAEEVQKIINRLHFHQAPEINRDTNGYFLIPPSEFDIKFYYNGAENPNIPKISTCVLTSIDLDYAPNGFSAYEVAGDNLPSVGKTGMPVAIRMSLQFTETEILLKDHFGGQRSNRSTQSNGVVEEWRIGGPI